MNPASRIELLQEDRLNECPLMREMLLKAVIADIRKGGFMVIRK